MLELLKSPEAMLFYTMLAAVLTPIVFGFLKSKAVKTKTKTDDEFLAAIEKIVETKINDKIAVAKAKTKK